MIIKLKVVLVVGNYTIIPLDLSFWCLGQRSFWNLYIGKADSKHQQCGYGQRYSSEELQQLCEQRWWQIGQTYGWRRYGPGRLIHQHICKMKD